MSFSFFFIKWRKERDQIKVEEMVVGLSLSESLVGTLY